MNIGRQFFLYSNMKNIFKIFIVLFFITLISSCRKPANQFAVLTNYAHQTFYLNDTITSNIEVGFTVYNNYCYNVNDYVFIITFIKNDGTWESYDDWGNYINDHSYHKIFKVLDGDADVTKIFYEIYEIRYVECYYGCCRPLFHQEYNRINYAR